MIRRCGRQRCSVRRLNDHPDTGGERDDNGLNGTRFVEVTICTQLCAGTVLCMRLKFPWEEER